MSITDDKGWGEVERKARRHELTDFKIVDLGGGYVIRPTESLDNARWYFHERHKALEWALYLQRQINLKRYHP